MPQFEHVYPSTTISVPHCPSIYLVDLLANEEIACARVGHVVSGILGDYLEFVQAQLQGCLVEILMTSVYFFPFEINLHFILYAHLPFFSFCDNIYMLHSYASSSEDSEKEGEEEENLPPSHASGSSSSFMETYPHFPAWQYEVMNPDGSYSFMTLDKLEHTPNVPWPNPVCS